MKHKKHNTKFRKALGKGLEEIRKELHETELNSKEYIERKKSGISKKQTYSKLAVRQRAGIGQRQYDSISKGSDNYNSHSLDRTIDALVGDSDWGEDVAKAILEVIKEKIWNKQ